MTLHQRKQGNIVTAKKPASKVKTTKKLPSTRMRTSKVKSTSKKKPTQMKSFRIAKPEEPFFTFRITRQTVYWLVLSFAILIIGIWVAAINLRVQSIYDQIDMQHSMIIQDEAILEYKLRLAQADKN